MRTKHRARAAWMTMLVATVGSSDLAWAKGDASEAYRWGIPWWLIGGALTLAVAALIMLAVFISGLVRAARRARSPAPPAQIPEARTHRRADR